MSFKIDLETNFNFTGTIEWQHKPSEKYNGLQYGQQRDIEIRGQYHPSERFFPVLKLKKVNLLPIELIIHKLEIQQNIIFIMFLDSQITSRLHLAIDTQN